MRTSSFPRRVNPPAKTCRRAVRRVARRARPESISSPGRTQAGFQPPAPRTDRECKRLHAPGWQVRLGELCCDAVHERFHVAPAPEGMEQKIEPMVSCSTVKRVAAAFEAGPQEPNGEIDAQRSSIVIHVGKSGLFAAAAQKFRSPLRSEVVTSGRTPRFSGGTAA
jgi:hypothetical protein